MEQRALDESFDDVRADVVRHLPAQRARPQLPRATVGHGRCDPRALGVEPVAIAEADEDRAGAAGVGDRETLELAACLAGGQQRAERVPGQIVGDVVALENPHHDRVGAGGERTFSRRLDVHGPNIPVPLR